MTQSARIIKVEEGRVWVVIGDPSSGKDTQVRSCCSDASTTIEVRNPGGLALNPGQMVQLGSDMRSIVGAVVLSVGVPLATFITAYALTPVVFGAATDTMKALGGIAGLVLGLLAPVLYFRLKKPDQAPVILNR